MQVQKLSHDIDIKRYLQDLGVDGGGISILTSKAKHHILYIKELHVGAANILKQDALSIGADLAVPRGTVIAAVPKVDCILIATQKELEHLAKKELAQPFGLKAIAQEFQAIAKQKTNYKMRVMGVINANDDSFFSKSRFVRDEAILKIEQMITDGAEIIDIGGVSSRPGADNVSATEELSRVEPIYKLIKELELYKKVTFSCDSYEPSVIQKALESGFSMVNDITGLENDEVAKLCAQHNASVVIMHMQGNPQSMQNNPHYEDVVAEVYRYLEKQVQKAKDFGIEEIIVDVGIGFGKTLEDNLHLIKHLEHFKRLGCEILVGASRKSMIDKISPSTVEERLSGTLTIHLEALRNGASIVRVHDVYEHTQAIKVHKALQRV